MDKSIMYREHETSAKKGSESESVIFQTQETSAKTISGRCRRGHLEKKEYVKIIVMNKSDNVIIYNISKSLKTYIYIYRTTLF